MVVRQFLSISAVAVLLSCSVVSVAQGQTDLSSQLDQLGQIQDSQDARRVALQRAQEAARRQAMQRQAAQAQARQRAMDQVNIRALEERQAFLAQKMKEHQDDRSFLDANRSLDIQQRQLRMKLEEARANHAEDYVHQELEKGKASIDNEHSVVQGDQKLKEDVGKAAQMSQRHWWQWGDH